MKSIHDQYAARPNSLEDIFLASFSVKYYATCQDDDYCNKECNRDDKEQGNHSQNQITLKDGLGKMRIRKKTAALRTHSYNIARKTRRRTDLRISGT